MDLRNKFKCEICEKGYFYKSSLKKHMLSHTKEEKKKSAAMNVVPKVAPKKFFGK